MASPSKESRGRPPVDLSGLSRVAGVADDLATVDNASADESAVDEARLRSFILEVSASRPQGVADASDLKLRIDKPEDREPRRPLRRRLRKVAAPNEDGVAVPVREVASGSVSAAEGARSPTARRADRPSTVFTPAARGERIARRQKRRRQGAPALIASSGFNCLVILLLLAGKLPGIEPLDELLWSTAPPLEEVAFSEVDFEVKNEELPVDGDDVPDELIDPGMASFGEMESTATLANVGDEATLAAGSLGGDMGALFGASGAGTAKFDAGLGGAPTAKFFGQEIGTGPLQCC